MSDKRLAKRTKQRDDSDRKYEQTPMRIAFQKWRDDKFKVNGDYWGADWWWESIDSREWTAFRAGWGCCATDAPEGR